MVERKIILIFLCNCCMWSFCITKSFLVSKHLSTYQKHFIYDRMGAGRVHIMSNTFKEGESVFLETLPSISTLIK